AYWPDFSGSLMTHVITDGQLFVPVRDNGIVYLCTLGFVDVSHPSVVTVYSVHAQSDHFDVPFIEVGFQSCCRSQLGGAYGRIVSRVGEKYTPAVTQIFIEVKGTMCGFRGKIWGGVS